MQWRGQYKAHVQAHVADTQYSLVRFCYVTTFDVDNQNIKIEHQL